MMNVLEKTKKLRSGASIPVLGLGTWELGGSICEKAVANAIELGYRHIDTAEAYGNEAHIGKAIRGASRERLFITSKVSGAHQGRHDVVKACDQSLKRLGTDYLDLYLLHWPNQTIPLEQTMEGMQQLLADGKVKSIGVSNFDVRLLQKAMDVSEAPICNDQVKYHPLHSLRELPRFCDDHDVALTAYSPLARGRVMDNPTLQKIGHQYGKSPAQVSLLWLLKQGAIVIPKSGSVEHLKANIELDGWDLSPEDMDAITTLTTARKPVGAGYT